jgi:AbrB family looped-hinge helix DNA binding protein
MAKAASARTRVSTKGQVILPKAIRDKRKWTAGTELMVEETAEGVLLRQRPVSRRRKSRTLRECCAAGVA